MDIAVWQSNSLYHEKERAQVLTINLTNEASRDLKPQGPEQNVCGEENDENINGDSLILF